MTAPQTIEMPDVPAIVISDGGSAHMVFTDHYTGSAGTVLAPIARAAAVARLRALADILAEVDA